MLDAGSEQKVQHRTLDKTHGEILTILVGSPGETRTDLFVSLGMTPQRGAVQVRSDGREILQLGKSVASFYSDLRESH